MTTESFEAATNNREEIAWRKDILNSLVSGIESMSIKPKNHTSYYFDEDDTDILKYIQIALKNTLELQIQELDEEFDNL